MASKKKSAKRPAKKPATKKTAKKKPATTKKPTTTKKPKGPPEGLDAFALAVSGDEHSTVVTEESDILWSTPKYHISTRNIALDKRLGGKGLPGGRLAEAFGPESCGKSTLCDQATAEVQWNQGLAVLIDSEHSRDRTYMDTLGVDMGVRCPHCPPPSEGVKPKGTEWVGSDTENLRRCKECHETFPGVKYPLVVVQVNYLEQVFDKLHYWATAARQIVPDPEVPAIVVWDSVAGTPTKEEWEAESLDDKFRASAAKVIKAGMRRAAQLIARSGVTLLVTNQVYSGMSKAWGNDKMTYGGDGIRYHATIRIDLLVVGQLKPRGASDEDRVPPVGQLVSAVVVKNKIAPPMQRARFAIVFGQGVDNGYALWFDNCGPKVKAPDNAFILQSGSWYRVDERLGDWPAWQGAHWGLNELVRANPELWPVLLDEYKALP
jgi:recombination protein RecA